MVCYAMGCGGSKDHATDNQANSWMSKDIGRKQDTYICADGQSRSPPGCFNRVGARISRYATLSVAQSCTSGRTKLESETKCDRLNFSHSLKESMIIGPTFVHTTTS